jgi:hypothetical protein
MSMEDSGQQKQWRTHTMIVSERQSIESIQFLCILCHEIRKVLNVTHLIYLAFQSFDFELTS